MKDNELKNIIGGVSINSSLINAIVKGINTILEIGRSIGTSIRKISSKTFC